jgi:RNA polymerase sigma factor (sigma-70 family)
MQADLELLERWRSGDGKAGSALVKRHFTAVRRFFSTKVRGPTDDLVQQTFIACVEAKDAFRGEASFRAYVLGLARLQLYMHYRKNSRLAALDFTTTSVCDLENSPSSLAAKREDAQLVQLALQTIPLDQQIVIELSYWEGLSTPEVALALGVPGNTVYSRLHRAKLSLRQALQRLTLTPAERDRAMALVSQERER